MKEEEGREHTWKRAIEEIAKGEKHWVMLRGCQEIGSDGNTLWTSYPPRKNIQKIEWMNEWTNERMNEKGYNNTLFLKC